MTAEIIELAAVRAARQRACDGVSKPVVAPPPVEPPDPLRGLYAFGALQREAKP
jgi:hypothetical protein